MDGGRARAYRSCMAEWLTVEVFDGEFAATRWRRAHEDALLEAALTHGASEWLWHETRWGVVLELLFDSDEKLDAYRVLPAVQAALDAVPVRPRGLVVSRGRGGGAGAWAPRRPRPAPRTAAAAVPEPDPALFLSGAVTAAPTCSTTHPAHGPSPQASEGCGPPREPARRS